MKILSSYFNSLQPDANALNTLSELRSWIHYSNQNISVNLAKIPLRNLQSWEYSRNRISHESGKFFAIEGLTINGNIKDKNVSWNQPIINQPEYGYLGIIVREFNGVLHFLLQAKIEPGNVNKVQLSPTIQATKSNFSRVHKGKTPDYLEYFISPNPDDILVDQLQTEQGARFLKKRNRNVIVYSSKIEAVNDKFMWLTLWQIEQLMRDDNIVNMDTRTVLSCLPFQFTSNHLNSKRALPESALLEFNHLFSFFSLNTEEYILNWLTRKKLECDILVRPLPLEKLDNWVCGDVKIYHESNKFFSVIGVEVSIENREVTSWTQPMIEPIERGLIGLCYCIINNTPHFLVRAKFEIGSFDRIEFAPSIQTSFSNLSAEDEWVLEIMKNGRKEFSVFQSEEGGRFFHEENLNELYEVPYFELYGYESSFQWMTFRQIHQMMRFSGLVNIQLRTILSMIQSGI